MVIFLNQGHCLRVMYLRDRNNHSSVLMVTVWDKLEPPQPNQIRPPIGIMRSQTC